MRRGVGLGLALGAALLLAPGAGAADKPPAIQQAVDRAVRYLKGRQGPDGKWKYTEIGATALAGLALVESGVPVDDPAVQKALAAVRDDSISCTKTYSLSLCILFLDLAGDANDDPLIESMAVRLLGGQDAQGGWSYDCPPLGEAEVQRLRDVVSRRKPAEAPASPGGRRTVQDLPREIQAQLHQVSQGVGAVAAPSQAPDNSNTQFAVFALWVARRRGIPVEKALQRVDARFRSTQQEDGGWLYKDFNAAGSTPTMACAGLIGLAVAHGSALESTLRTRPNAGAARGRPAGDLNNDPVVRKGLVYLGDIVAHPFGNQPPPPPPLGDQLLGLRGDSTAYYFLFSLERVAVAYGLDTIGDRDWYKWGADYLLRNQTPEGGWSGGVYESYGNADTSFALLFLARANLAKDLSATLKGLVRDPAQRQLRAVDSPAAAATGPADRVGPPKETRLATQPAPADPEVARLSDELVKAPAAEREAVLRRLRDGKGGAYTDALAYAIRQLDGPARDKARDALADRLTRMTSATLGDKLQDGDAEVRRAAALACAMKDDRTHVARLIELLRDPEAGPAAHAALKSLSGGQDFGPARDAAPADVARAADAWKAWFDKSGPK